MTVRKIGILIGIAAATAWGLAGSMPLHGASRLVALLVVGGVSAILTVALIRLPASATVERFDGGVYALAVVAEILAIVFAVVLLNRLSRQSLLSPVIAMIVGAHFLGLWRATGARRFVALAIGLFLVGLVGLWFPASCRLLVTGFGCAVVLWTSAAVTLVSGAH